VELIAPVGGLDGIRLAQGLSLSVAKAVPGCRRLRKMRVVGGRSFFASEKSRVTGNTSGVFRCLRE
jgi:hypothetical protein